MPAPPGNDQAAMAARCCLTWTIDGLVSAEPSANFSVGTVCRLPRPG